jgi:hypothetical protein
MRVLVAFALLIAGPGHALAQDDADWVDYTNGRLGYSLELPIGQFTALENASGIDWVALEEKNGEAAIRAYGRENFEDYSITEALVEILGDGRARRITYTALRDDWLALSGFTTSDLAYPEDTIFYLRAEMNADRSAYSVFEITFPTARKPEFEAMVERLSFSLTPPQTCAENPQTLICFEDRFAAPKS